MPRVLAVKAANKTPHKRTAELKLEKILGQQNQAQLEVRMADDHHEMIITNTAKQHLM